MNNNLYLEWFDCKDEKEECERDRYLSDKYGMFEVYRANYWGKDGRFHREVFVFNRDMEEVIA